MRQVLQISFFAGTKLQILTQFYATAQRASPLGETCYVALQVFSVKFSTTVLYIYRDTSPTDRILVYIVFDVLRSALLLQTYCHCSRYVFSRFA